MNIKVNAHKSRKTEIDIDTARSLRLYNRVDELKRKIRHKEKEKQIERKKEQGNPFTFHYLKTNAFAVKFQRNPFEKERNEINAFNFQKYKNAIDNANRNMEKNRLDHVLRKLAMHCVQAKSRLNLKSDDDFADIKERIAKKRKTHIEKAKSQLSPSNSNINNVASMRKRYSIIPPKHGKNYYMLQSMGNYYSTETTRAKTASSQIRLNKKSKLRVINNPICTTNINELFNEYDRLKMQLRKEKKQFEKRRLHTDEEINMLMKTRSEMKLTHLKHKYINCKFPIEKQKKIYTKNTFMEKMMTEVEQSDILYY